MIMKKTFNNIRTLAALLMAGAAFAACNSSDDNIIENQQPANPSEQVYTLTINASKGDGATTRALDLSGTSLVASWANGDELTVINKTKSSTPLGGTLVASNASGNTATFSGALTGTIAVGDKLILTYHEHDYFTDFPDQDGTLKGTNGAEKYDVAKAEVTVASVDAGNITISEASASFKTWTAMLKLTLQDNAATPNKLNATSLTISVDGIGELLAFSPTATTYTANGSDGVLYFALPCAEDVAYIKMGATSSDIDTKKATLASATVTFTATAGGKTYTVTKPGYKFTEGKYYAATLTMAEVPAAKAAAEATDDDLGKVIGADGNIYDDGDDATSAGTTPVAKIVYVGDDAETSPTYNHGLALALSDVSDLQFWCSQTPAIPEYYNTCRPTQYSDVSKAKTDMAGIANTDALVNHTGHTHYAARAARNYNSGTHPTGTSEWFLPSVGQWDKMATAAGSYTNLRINVGLWGSSNYEYYWSSSEKDAQYAWQLNTWVSNGNWSGSDKHIQNHVRACLAF